MICGAVFLNRVISEFATWASGKFRDYPSTNQNPTTFPRWGVGFLATHLGYQERQLMARRVDNGLVLQRD